MAMCNVTPTKRSLLAVTTAAFIRAVAEAEYLQRMEDSLELESLVTGDPAYHPLGRHSPTTY